MVEKAAAIAVLVLHRPAECVLDIARLEIRVIGRNGPDFLQADAVFLRVAIGFQVILDLELLGQRAARTFCEEDVFAEKLHAWLEFRLL